MTFPRNRKVGSFGDIDFGHTRFSNPTSNPRLLPENHENRERPFPAPVLKTRAEWIRARKFARNPWARGLGNADIIAVMAGHSRPKDGVASAGLCLAIHVFRAVG
jgi:hypothetical protein